VPQATNAATNQGAQFGSGLAGGSGSDPGSVVLQSTRYQPEPRHRKKTSSVLTADISQKKQQLAQVQGDAATDQAIRFLSVVPSLRWDRLSVVLARDAYGGTSSSSSGNNYVAVNYGYTASNYGRWATGDGTVNCTYPTKPDQPITVPQDISPIIPPPPEVTAVSC